MFLLSLKILLCNMLIACIAIYWYRALYVPVVFEDSEWTFRRVGWSTKLSYNKVDMYEKLKCWFICLLVCMPVKKVLFTVMYDNYWSRVT